MAEHRKKHREHQNIRTPSIRIESKTPSRSGAKTLSVSVPPQFAGMGAAYGTAKSRVGVASMGVMRSELVIKSIVPVVMASVLDIYGLIIAVIISTGINPKAKSYYLFDGYAHLSFGLACGLAGLSAGMAIGIVGDAGVRLKWINHQEQLSKNVRLECGKRVLHQLSGSSEFDAETESNNLLSMFKDLSENDQLKLIEDTTNEGVIIVIEKLPGENEEEFRLKRFAKLLNNLPLESLQMFCLNDVKSKWKIEEEWL
ncbi:V-type proton ATPase 16 kDa proteolipid subunit [Camellia lanceoleosa]|uniref:V-type proton ATPase 16 kDa proteolipid subunit n=1 Tax=Camellia lanceoleosa TaxID=1840588 RepID=A0ACC0F2Q2_9ERIC|nr:V-type proton ATPase 16 kDa proteolipid subunit [Camellia lanceoleosa]